MSSDMSKCVNFSVILDIAEVSNDSLSQKYHKCMYPIMHDWKMVLVLVGGVQMFLFTVTDITCGMCGLSVPAIHMHMLNIITYYILFSFLQK